MPVKFAGGTFLQVLLGAGDVVARGQIRDDLLSDPTSREQTCLGVGEAPLQVRHHAVVS